MYKALQMNHRIRARLTQVLNRLTPLIFDIEALQEHLRNIGYIKQNDISIPQHYLSAWLEDAFSFVEEAGPTARELSDSLAKLVSDNSRKENSNAT